MLPCLQREAFLNHREIHEILRFSYYYKTIQKTPQLLYPALSASLSISSIFFQLVDANNCTPVYENQPARNAFPQ